jgi:predicted secreted protein
VIAPVRRDFTSGSAGTAPFPPDLNTEQSNSAPPAVQPGVPGEATFRLRGVDTGTVPVLFEYRRAWESGAPAKSVAFEVVVR